MSKPLISVVIPTYNSAHMIGGAIRSCFAQTLRDFEIIVVDDERSTDDIGAVLAPFARCEIRLIRGFPGTAAAARNGGVWAASGEYVAFLDADDEFMPNKLVSCLSVLQPDPNVVVYSRSLVDRGVSRLWLRPVRGLREGEDIYEYLLLHKGWVHPSTVMLRADLARAHPFREDMVYGDDTRFAVDLWRSGVRLHMIEEPLVVYRDLGGPTQLSQSPVYYSAAAGANRGFIDWVESEKEYISDRVYHAYRAWYLARFIARDAPLDALSYIVSAVRENALSASQAAVQLVQVFAPRLYRRACDVVTTLAGTRCPIEVQQMRKHGRAVASARQELGSMSAEQAKPAREHVPEPIKSSPTAKTVPLVFPAQLSEEATERFRHWSDELLKTSRYRVQGGYADRVAELLASSLQLPDDWSVMPLRSGTDSLLRALHLAGVKPGDRVIVPDLAFHAVAASVLQLGAVPVFADVDAIGWNLDPASVAVHLGREATAVIAVDNYGTPTDLKTLASLTRAAGAKLILDACESLGTVYAVGPPACQADFIVTSFSFTKPIHAAGMGGALCGPADAIAAAKRVPELMCAHFRLPEINAAYLVAAWPDLAQNIAHLRSIYDRYTELGTRLGFIGQRETGRSTRIHAPLLLPEGLGASERDWVITKLEAAGIASRGFFQSQSVLFGFGDGPPVSASIADRVVCLPSGPGMDFFDVDWVCASLSQVVRSAPWLLHPPVSARS